MSAAGMASTGLARASFAAGGDLGMPSGASETRLEFETAGIERWKVVTGRWTVEDIEGAPSGKKVLVQRATDNDFDVIVTPPGPYTAVDVSVRFKPISGKTDASGGIVFRFTDGRYYVVRGNALEDNFRLYIYESGRRRQLASARVTPPMLGAWHSMRVVAVNDEMQAWLDGKRLLQHRDSRLPRGHMGLWTKADSVTAFDDLTIRGVA
jgi:hypothetical protein